MMGGSPAKVLEQVNTQVCCNNDEEMFVTVWFGVLDINTGKVTAANAGHEYPIIRKADGSFELLKDKHGFVIGGMEGMRYKDYEFTLEKGGTLFLYTDGVAEATNGKNELFGTDRMLEALNKAPDAPPKELLSNMKQSVDEFVGDAPQFDDLTMLGVKLI
jgi:sigma-B regulation protein RsbU (phosphoserine phosphatase)